MIRGGVREAKSQVGTLDYDSDVTFGKERGKIKAKRSNSSVRSIRR
jgi:hypothetical protein